MAEENIEGFIVRLIARAEGATEISGCLVRDGEEPAILSYRLRGVDLARVILTYRDGRVHVKLGILKDSAAKSLDGDINPARGYDAIKQFLGENSVQAVSSQEKGFLREYKLRGVTV